MLSETAACVSEEEGRRLIAAAERSTATYPFAENYVLHPHIRLLRESVDSGELGAIELVEADYLHSLSPEDTAAHPGTSRGRGMAGRCCSCGITREGLRTSSRSGRARRRATRKLGAIDNAAIDII
ncbi:hypothetical protein ACWCPQ_11520 [Nocardia sp. NPDC001965]